jgi:hypothetical protein
MVEQKRPRVVLDVDNTLRDFQGNLMPGSVELVSGLKKRGFELALWTFSSMGELCDFADRHAGWLGSNGDAPMLVGGSIREVVNAYAPQWGGDYESFRAIAGPMRREGAKDPRLFGSLCSVLVDDDPFYETFAAEAGFPWVDPGSDEFPDRNQHPHAWAEAIILRIMAVID